MGWGEGAKVVGFGVGLSVGRGVGGAGTGGGDGLGEGRGEGCDVVGDVLSSQSHVPYTAKAKTTPSPWTSNPKQRRPPRSAKLASVTGIRDGNDTKE